MATHIAKMVSMAQSPEKVKETMPAVVAEKAEAPSYPWGLCLRIEKEQIEKLKLDGAQVGDTIHVFALGKVTSVSARASEGGDDHSSIEIQITDMAAENEDRENEEADPEEKERATRKRWYGDKSED